jgi:TonB family protein
MENQREHRGFRFHLPKSTTNQRRFDQFRRAGAILLLLSVVATNSEEDDYTPSAANDCGRSGTAMLGAVPGTHNFPPYPAKAWRNGEQGPTTLSILINKEGIATDVTVSKSSGSAELDEAAASFVKETWRWQPPPTECQEKGVMSAVVVNWTLRPANSALRIYSNSSYYPSSAHNKNERGLGTVQVFISPDGKATGSKVLKSTGFDDLDAAMMSIVQGMKYSTGGRAAALTFPIEFHSEEGSSDVH